MNHGMIINHDYFRNPSFSKNPRIVFTVSESRLQSRSFSCVAMATLPMVSHPCCSTRHCIGNGQGNLCKYVVCRHTFNVSSSVSITYILKRRFLRSVAILFFHQGEKFMVNLLPHVAQWIECRIHDLKVVGSSPTAANALYLIKQGTLPRLPT